MIIENLLRTEGEDLEGSMKRVYSYRLIKNQMDIICDWNTVPLQSYGIEIERQDILNDHLIDVCRDCVKNISPNRYKVHNLLKLLYDSQVSPIYLVDVIGDYVDEYILDFDKQLKSMAY
ncbi:MAG: DUF6514 family protein [Clostridium sp.]|jgi:hypothetical protein|uniref:DUF6514 family protein n=1 Tax=Clostridium sp. TaxID=1506 RepID=UPI0025BA26EB|nr:DUF6514 family protein [Clostridium sp.]MCH3965867.1 DUF6514 family protein [Clostridium sp.]